MTLLFKSFLFITWATFAKNLFLRSHKHHEWTFTFCFHSPNELSAEKFFSCFNSACAYQLYEKRIVCFCYTRFASKTLSVVFLFPGLCQLYSPPQSNVCESFHCLFAYFFLVSWKSFRPIFSFVAITLLGILGIHTLGVFSKEKIFFSFYRFSNTKAPITNKKITNTNSRELHKGNFHLLPFSMYRNAFVRHYMLRWKKARLNRVTVVLLTIENKLLLHWYTNNWVLLFSLLLLLVSSILLLKKDNKRADRAATEQNRHRIKLEFLRPFQVYREKRQVNYANNFCNKNTNLNI